MKKMLFVVLGLLCFGTLANAQSSSIGLRLGLPYFVVTFSHDFKEPKHGLGIRFNLGTIIVPVSGPSLNPVILTVEGLYRVPVLSPNFNIYGGLGLGGGITSISPNYFIGLAYLNLGAELTLIQGLNLSFDIQPLVWTYFVNQTRILIAPIFSLGLSYRF